MNKIFCYIVRVILILISLLVIFWFADAFISEPATLGEGDTATKEELVKFCGITLLIWIPIAIVLWSIIKKVNH